MKAAHEDSEVLIQSISSVIISLDEEDRVARWNPVAEKVFDIHHADAIFKPFWDLHINWKDPEYAREALGAFNGDSLSVDLQFTNHNDETINLDMRVCPTLDEQGSNAKLIVANDVTRQKGLQSQLDQAQRLESVGQLAAGVAHEINTPMQYIGDNVSYVANSVDKLEELLKLLPCLVDESVTDEQLLQMRNELTVKLTPRKVKSSLEGIPDALENVIEGVEAVSEIVAAMKEFSHPGGNEKMNVDLNHILESTITVAKNEWKYVADVELSLDENLSIIQGLQSELNQAFLNIIVNASHSITDRIQRDDFAKGKVAISTEQDETHVLVKISDTGGGIPEKI